MSLASLFARTYLRYLAPLTLLSVVTFAPLVLLALRLPAPGTAPQAVIAVRAGWMFAALGVIPLLVLVGGVAPAVRAVAAGTPRSQLGVLAAGLAGLARALVPCLLAIVAITIGGLALVVPGLLLLVLLALTGASTEPGMPGPLADSVAIARRHALAIAAVLVVTIAVIAVVLVLVRHGLPIPLPKKPTLADRTEIRNFARIAIAVVAIAAPVPAIVLAAIHTRR